MNISRTFPRQNPLIIAHRGSSSVAPENTLAAFSRAVTDFADAVEFDVHLTKDNQIAVIHDDRIDRTTNGGGFVRDFTLSDLKQFDAGSWFDGKFSSEKIPSLAEVLELVSGKVAINIEIKEERLRYQRVDIVDNCLKILREFGMSDVTMISSFGREFLHRVRSLNRKIAIGFLYDPFYQMHRSPIAIAKLMDAQYLILGRSGLRKRYVEEAHKKKILVGEFTVDTKLRTLRSLRYGVDAIITNKPHYMRGIISTNK